MICIPEQSLSKKSPFSVVKTLLLKKWSLVSKLILLLFQMLLREAKAFPGLESLALCLHWWLSWRQTNFTTSPGRMIGASDRWFKLMYLVFLVLTLSPSIAAVDARSTVVACMSVWR